jgi:hypothetical protein
MIGACGVVSAIITCRLSKERDLALISSGEEEKTRIAEVIKQHSMSPDHALTLKIIPGDISHRRDLTNS